MPVDSYMKVVLSIIAAALVVISLQNLWSGGAQAQQSPAVSKVVICDAGNPNRCVGITQDGRLSVAQ